MQQLYSFSKTTNETNNHPTSLISDLIRAAVLLLRRALVRAVVSRRRPSRLSGPLRLVAAVPVRITMAVAVVLVSVTVAVSVVVMAIVMTIVVMVAVVVVVPVMAVAVMVVAVAVMVVAVVMAMAVAVLSTMAVTRGGAIGCRGSSQRRLPRGPAAEPPNICGRARHWFNWNLLARISHAARAAGCGWRRSVTITERQRAQGG